MDNRDKIKLEDIIMMLNLQWDSLVTELVPNVKMSSQHFIIGDLDGNPGKSLVFFRGPKAGAWRDYATEEKGDALILIEKQVTGGDRGQAIIWAKQWLGIDDENHVTFQARRQTARKHKANNDKAIIEKREKMWGIAKAIYLNAQVKIVGTMARDYICDRGIDLGAKLFDMRALRFDPECYEAETRDKHPALIASISVPYKDKLMMSIHRTYLRFKDDGTVVKLDVTNPKKVLGDYGGGYIPLWRGQSKKILYKADPSEWVVITEGIEDGLSIVMADPSKRVLVAISLGNMGAIKLPNIIKKVILVKDNDENNMAAESSFQAAVKWHMDQGRRVRIFKTPAKYGKDVNDWLRAED